MELRLSLHDVAKLGERIRIFVITGGPCGGKTSALSRLHRTLTDRGYRVLVVPEAATKLINGGIDPISYGIVPFQAAILRDILMQEYTFVEAARRYRDQGQNVVILCDRGIMDNEAYVGTEQFGAIIKSFGFTYHELCDHRYHAVFHLVTAADGAEEHYTLANNAARSETPEEARALDARTLAAWQRHQHPRIFDNSTDFEEKLRRVTAEMFAFLGDPVPREIEEKFLLDPATIPGDLRAHCHATHITQHYLVSPHPTEEHRVRRREDAGGCSYYYTIKRHAADGERIETERMLTHREYTALLSLHDPTLQPIEKDRVTFFFGGQFFEVDFFRDYPVVLMEAEKPDKTRNVPFPPFLSVIRNVTDDQRYYNRNIAAGSLR